MNSQKYQQVKCEHIADKINNKTCAIKNKKKE